MGIGGRIILKDNSFPGREKSREGCIIGKLEMAQGVTVWGRKCLKIQTVIGLYLKSVNIPWVGLWTIAILANITALQRIWDVRRQTRSSSKES